VLCLFDVKWQQELAKLLDDVGAVNAALEVYLRLQSWENVIACYAKLGYQQKVRTTCHNLSNNIFGFDSHSGC